MTIDDAAQLWHPAGVYLNTASYGLPPDPAWRALQEALEDWRHGRTSWEHWGDRTDDARATFAGLVGVPVDWVAVGATVSGLTGLIAASLPEGGRVLAPEIEFTSSLWPFLAQGRGVTVTCVPAARLAEAIDARTDVVAFSSAHSSTGEVADLEAVAAAARHHGALTVVDATQSCGWQPIDATRFDFVTCGAYKWLMSPRGSAFVVVRPEHLEWMRPLAAGWFAGERPHESYYGPPLRLAETARRLDTSPAWFSWVGTAAALEVVARIGVEAIHAHDVGLANRFREELGMEPGRSAIVALDAPAAAAERLRERGVMAAMRAGRLRTSWHVYNTDGDVEVAVGAVRG